MDINFHWKINMSKITKNPDKARRGNTRRDMTTRGGTQTRRCPQVLKNTICQTSFIPIIRIRSSENTVFYRNTVMVLLAEVHTRCLMRFIFHFKHWLPLIYCFHTLSISLSYHSPHWHTKSKPAIQRSQMIYEIQHIRWNIHKVFVCFALLWSWYPSIWIRAKYVHILVMATFLVSVQSYGCVLVPVLWSWRIWVKSTDIKHNKTTETDKIIIDSGVNCAQFTPLSMIILSVTAYTVSDKIRLWKVA